MVRNDQKDICNPNNRDTIIVGNAFVGGLGSLSGIGKGESHEITVLHLRLENIIVRLK